MKIHDLFAKKRLLFLSAVLFAFQLNVRAAEEDAPPALQIHGYGTAGYSSVLAESSPAATGYGMVGKSGTYLYNSLLGINLSYALTDKVTFYGQLTATGSYFASAQSTASYPVDADMAMLSYRPFDWMDIRIGRQIVPIWMASEQIDVGVTYPWIRPPMDVYNLAPVKSATGLGVDFQKSLGGIVDVKVGARAGEGTYTDPGSYAAPVRLERLFLGYGEFTFNNILKLRASYGSTDAFATTTGSAQFASANASAIGTGVYAAAYASTYGIVLSTCGGAVVPDCLAAAVAAGKAAGEAALAADSAAISAASTTTGSNNFESEFTFYSFGGQLDWNNILLMAEYAATNQRIASVVAADPNNTALSPNAGVYKYRAWYVTGAYHFGDWTPHFTYSTAEKNLYGANFTTLAGSSASAAVATVSALAAPSSAQHTYTIGLNYNFTPTIIGKAQFEQIRTNDAPSVTILNGAKLPGNDILNMGEAAVSFVF